MPCDLTHMWNKNKQNKNNVIDTENVLVVTRSQGCGEIGKMGRGSQLYGDRWKLDIWW